MKILINWLLSTLAIIIAAYLINGFWPGSVVVTSIWSALVAALVLSIVNSLIRPIVKLISLPLTLLTFGLFILVVNALMIMLVDWLTPGFAIIGFWTALIFAAILTVIGWVFHKIA